MSPAAREVPPAAVPEATVDARVGGPFELRMQSPEGESHWTRGRFVEIDAPARLVIDMEVTDAGGMALFGARTTAAFTDVAEGTRLDVEHHGIREKGKVAGDRDHAQRHHPVHPEGGEHQGRRTIAARIGRQSERDQFRRDKPAPGDVQLC